MSMAVIRLHTLHNSIQRAGQSLSRTRNSPRELNQARDASWMGDKKFCERTEMRSLLLDIKQDAGWSRERLARCVCDNAQGQQRNAAVRARARDEFCFHIDRRRSRFAPYPFSLLARID
jgi:hypothetical protein